MDENVRSNIATLLQQSISAISKNDSFRLKQLSDSNIKSALVFQDEDTLSITVVIYALSKLIERTTKKRIIISYLQKAANALHSNNDGKYRSQIRALINAIRVEDSRLRKFLSNVIEQAQVKKGCALCDNGLSIEKAASILKVSRWDLMQYLGKTQVYEQSSELIPTEKRLALARSVFK